MKKVVDFFKGIEIEGVMMVLLITFVAVLTAASLFSIIVFAYLGEWAHLVTPIICLICTVVAFWIPMYLEWDDYKTDKYDFRDDTDA